MSDQYSSLVSRNRFLWVLVSAAAGLFMACGDRDVVFAAPDQAPPSTTPAEGTPTGAGSLYAVTTQLYSPDQNLAYVELVSDIDDIGSALTTTLEIPGYGLAVGRAAAGHSMSRAIRRRRSLATR
jgi:hypothetical protein